MKLATLPNGCVMDLDSIQYIMSDKTPAGDQYGELRVKCDTSVVTLLFKTLESMREADRIILNHINEIDKTMTQEERKKQAIDAFAKFDKENCMGYGWFDRADIWWTAVRWADEHNFYFQDLNPKETEVSK